MVMSMKSLFAVSCRRLPLRHLQFLRSYSMSPTDPNAWKTNGTLMYYESPDIKHSSKIACFGWNKCLVTTSLFMPRGGADWKLRYKNVPEKLQELHDNGFKLVVFCNQSAIGQAQSEKTRLHAIQTQTTRMGEFLQLTQLPFQMFVATSRTSRGSEPPVADIYRKPAPGMWQFLVDHCNGGISPDMAECFFVGGVAGREQNAYKRKDHSDYDLVFAENTKLKFYTDDAYFGTEKREKGPSTKKEQPEQTETQATTEKAPSKRKKKEKQEKQENQEKQEGDQQQKDQQVEQKEEKVLEA